MPIFIFLGLRLACQFLIKKKYIKARFLNQKKFNLFKTKKKRQEISQIYFRFY